MKYKVVSINLLNVLDDIDSLPDMIHPTTLEDYKKLWIIVVKRIRNTDKYR